MKRNVLIAAAGILLTTATMTASAQPAKPEARIQLAILLDTSSSMDGLIEQAKNLAGRKGLGDKIQFRIGNALKLPFSDRSFDAAFSQAVLVLLTDQERAVREAMRVIRPGGAAGWLELSWKKTATPEFMDGVSNVLCAYCMRNVRTFDGW